MSIGRRIEKTSPLAGNSHPLRLFGLVSAENNPNFTDAAATPIEIATSVFIQASLCKIQGLLKDSPTVFKDYLLLKKIYMYLYVKAILRKC